MTNSLENMEKSENFISQGKVGEDRQSQRKVREIMILPQKALMMHIFVKRCSQNFPGVTSPDPHYWGTPPKNPPLSPLHGSISALRASAKSLQYLVHPFPILLEKSGKSQGISFGLESGHLVPYQSLDDAR